MAKREFRKDRYDPLLRVVWLSLPSRQSYGHITTIWIPKPGSALDICQFSNEAVRNGLPCNPPHMGRGPRL